MKKIFFLSSLIVLFFTFHLSAAAENPSPFFFDNHYLQHGATVTDADQQFFLGIRPFVLDQESLVTIENYDLTQHPLPENLKAISPAMIYDIKMPDPYILPANRPLIIKMFYNSDSNFHKSFYHWDNNARKWQSVATKLYLEEGYAAAFMHFPYTPVVIAEDINRLLEPVKVTNTAAPNINATAAVIMDAQTKKILYEKNKDKKWWPASITKLLSSLVLLDNQPDFQNIFTYEQKYQTIGGRLTVKPGETLSVKDIFFSTLIGSTNNTANMYPDIVGKTQKNFLTDMNTMAAELGMNSSQFSDPSGLSTANTSTAYDLALLTNESGKFWNIFQASTAPSYSFATKNTGQTHYIKNTNKLLGKTDYQFIVSKTGYLDESGYNNSVKIKTKNGHELVIVVLGTATSQERFSTTHELARYALDNFSWDEK